VGHADKLFTGALATGGCAFHHAGWDQSVVFRFDPARVPFVGVWRCQGGWPQSRASKHYTVGIEPCTGRPDALAEAARRGECMTLAPGEITRWWLELRVIAGPPPAWEPAHA